MDFTSEEMALRQQLAQSSEAEAPSSSIVQLDVPLGEAVNPEASVPAAEILTVETPLPPLPPLDPDSFEARVASTFAMLKQFDIGTTQLLLSSFFF